MALEHGNQLWEGHRMILPEHEDALRRKRRRQEEYRPLELDPDALETIGRKIQRSCLDEKAGPDHLCQQVRTPENRRNRYQNQPHRKMDPPGQ